MSSTREAVTTIASAYSRPPGRIPEKKGSEPLDNSIREALLQQPDGAAFLRVFEGLRLLGVHTGATFTRREALILLKGIVGDYSIRKALAFQVRNELLFPVVPSPAPPSPANADPFGLPENKAKTCFVPQQEPTQSPNPAHRPTVVYRMPLLNELRQQLNVQPTKGDPIELNELSSPKMYRQALQREFIKRQPGQYPQGWLAQRLGVTTRSIYSYHRTEGIQAMECFHSTILDWNNYERLLPPPSMAGRIGLETRGRFIEDERGKRYPASVGMASKLLTQRHLLTLKERTFSHYQYGFGAVQQQSLSQQLKIDVVQHQRLKEKAQTFDDPVPMSLAEGEAISPYSTSMEMKKGEAITESDELPRQQMLAETPITSPNHVRSVLPSARRRQRYYPAPLTDEADEQIARWLYDEMARLTEQKAFSISNARCLVDLYGREAVSTTLKQMLAMHRKGKISNPAGFMVVASRVSWGAANERTGTRVTTPRFRGEQRKAGRKVANATRSTADLIQSI